MPVDFDTYDPDDQFTFEEGSNPRILLTFLAQHPDMGFTPKELHEETGIPRGSVGATLTRLEERGLVRHKEPYWAAPEDDRLASLSAKGSGDSLDNRLGPEDKTEWVGDTAEAE